MNFFSSLRVSHGVTRTTVKGTLLMAVAILNGCGGTADPPQPKVAVTVGPTTPVVSAPSVTPVQNQTVTVGQSATFTEIAMGTAPLTYQWSKNGTPIAGAVAASYTTPATVATDTGAMFTVEVSNGAGHATSEAALLTVTVPVTLTITQQPQNASVTAGATATFSAAAECSAGSVSWQWQRSGDGGATYAAIASATMSSFTFTTAGSDNAASFRSVASCSTLSQTTNSASLTVTTPMAGGPSLTELVTNLQVAAQLIKPAGVAVDASGAIYIVDSLGQAIRKLALDGSVTTLAGTYVTSGSGRWYGNGGKFQCATRDCVRIRRQFIRNRFAQSHVTKNNPRRCGDDLRRHGWRGGKRRRYRGCCPIQLSLRNNGGF